MSNKQTLALSLLTLSLAACTQQTTAPRAATSPATPTLSSTANATLTLNALVSLQVTTPGFTNRSLRHSSGLAFTEVVSSSSDETLKKDATFKIVSGLADASCYSFQSYNFPGDYLRHASSRVVKAPLENSDLFRKDATWCARVGLSGSGVSLESLNFPGSYLRHFNSEVWLAKSGGPLASDSANSFNADSSWNVIAPWFSPPASSTCALWDPAKVYVQGDLVSLNGVNYRANYWTQNNNPATNSTPNSGAPWSVVSSGCGPTNPPPVNPPPVNPPSSGFFRPNGKLVVSYYGNWTRYAGGGSYTVDKLPAGKVDVVNVGFAKIVNGQCASTDEGADLGYNKPNIGGNFGDILKWKAANPGGKALIALGGWSWYGTNVNPNAAFTSVAATDAGRKAFVASCIDLFIKGNYAGFNSLAGVFDGIDIDWEYPGFSGGESPDFTPPAADGDQIRRNYISLLQEFRTQMDAYKPGVLLTAAVVADPAKTALLDVSAMDKLLNWFNVMTYDFHGAFDPVTNFNTPLNPVTGDPVASSKFTVSQGLQAYVAKGAPASHLLPGVAFYGRGWSNVQAGPGGDGLFQPASGAGATGGEQPGTAGYWKLVDIFKAPGWVFRYNTQAEAPYAFNPGTREFWSYDDERSIGAKAAYFRANGYGGAMYWMANQDSNNVLLNKLSSVIKQ